MPGIFMNVMGNATAAPQARYGNAPAPSTATEAAYGVGSAPPNPRAGLHPGGPTGMAFWTGVAGVAFLLFVYRSLPG